MSRESKFLRPKVRFSPNLDGEEDASGSKCPGTLNGPRIRSIVNFDKKIKVVAVDGERNVGQVEEVKEETSGVQEVAVKEVTKTASKDESGGKDPGKSAVPALALPAALGDRRGGKASCLSKAGPGQAREGAGSKRGKENEEATVNKHSKTEHRRILDKAGKAKPTIKRGTKHSAHDCQENLTAKEPNARAEKAQGKVKPLSVQNRHAGLGTKPKSVGVMPCHRHKKASPVKKTVIRDAVGRRIKPDVGPGVIHRKREEVRRADPPETTGTKRVTSGERLAKPEFNSIMCTVEKLKEARKERIVPDMEHLPAAYKSLVNGRVTAALDFRLDEAIYKNLIDLSIDEKQLPGRLLRSKDPEPREKDVVPQLSDFFTPTDTGEYCEAVPIVPRALDSSDGWSAFKISDKIIEWKQSLDDEH